MMRKLIVILRGLTIILLLRHQILTESRSIDMKCKSFNHTIQFANEINVGTVLFKEAELLGKCLTLDRIRLLIARRVMQNLIPKKIPKDFPALLSYVKKAEVILEAKAAEDKEKCLLKRALYDSLGGYLFAVAIPVLNEAYYAGNVRYEVAAELHYTLHRMMRFLRTNGGTWSDPCDMSTIPTKVTALSLKLCDESKACDVFVLEQHITDTLNEIYPKNKSKCTTQKCSRGIARIQIPYLDDNFYPSAIVLPLKQHALHSLLSACAVEIIPKYYVQAMKCLSNREHSNDDIIYFNKALHKWIISTVLPHLNELSRWYPGFGGVMRVVETMNQRGLVGSAVIRENIRPYNACVTEIGVDGFLIRTANQFLVYSRSRWFWILIAFLLALILLFVCLALIRSMRSGTCHCAADADSSYSASSRDGRTTSLRSSN